MLHRVMEKVLVAGAGISGAVTASILRKNLPEKCHLTVWDKSNGTGGRMGTSRSPQDSSCTVDLGAQYISAEPADYTNHERFYTELQESNILRPLEGLIVGDKPRPEGTRHFVCPAGVGTIPKHYLKQSGAELKFGHLITKLDEHDGRWTVTTDRGITEEFDAVVLTMPVPQILALQGSIRDRIDAAPSVRNNLEAVEYSARFVLGLFYPPGTDLQLPWAAKYFQGDPVIVFVAQDNTKRGSPSSPPSLLVHTSVPFSLRHLEEDKEAVCMEHVLPRLREILPGLPAHTGVKCHKWRYSQVFRGYPSTPGALPVHSQPPLVLAGDAFTGSKFDRCVDSATEAAAIVTAAANQGTAQL